MIAAPGPINKKAVREYLDSGSFGTTETDYTGQILDAGSGLHFYNARYYDSTLGRFISADEIIPGTGDPSAFNRYSYTLNNPLKYTDPTGNHSDQWRTVWLDEERTLSLEYAPCPGHVHSPARNLWNDMEAAAAHGYIPHIRRIGEEKLDGAGRKVLPARQWVVERTLAWLSKCRALLVRYEKKVANYLGLIQLACMLLWFRRYHRLTVLG